MPRQRAKERACEKAIKETLAYRAFFKYPLSFHQLATYLISKRTFDYDFFNKTIKRLLKNKSVRVKDGKYYVSGVKPLSWDLRAKRTKRIIKKNRPIFALLASIPWVKMVGITGSVGAYNPEKKADVDIFVIASKNRLWLTRGFVVVLLKLAGSYHVHGKKDGKVCPNILVDEEGLAWPKDKRNSYTAHEIILLQPVVNKNDTYLKFLRANKWALEYFPQFYVNIPKRFKGTRAEKSVAVQGLENIARKMQMRFMRDKKTTEVTTKHLIHFNKKDSTRRVLREFKKHKKKC